MKIITRDELFGDAVPGNLLNLLISNFTDALIVQRCVFTYFIVDIKLYLYVRRLTLSYISYTYQTNDINRP